MKLRIPPAPDGTLPDFPRIMRSVVESDQFDDWLPDCVFFSDRQRQLPREADRLAQSWRSSEIETAGAVPLSLPRSDGQLVPAMALPFDLRCIAYAVITDVASRIQGKPIRDKVRGFGLASDGGSGIFDEPGVGMSALAPTVINAALVGGADEIRIVDVVRFNASAQPRKLADILTSIGVDNAQARFLRQLAELGPGGLPSVDDAFAFLYNHYLLPVDEALARRRVNFFRYRDEYFVLSGADAEAVQQELRKHGLVGRPLAPIALDPEARQRLQEAWASRAEETADPDQIGTLNEVLAPFGSGWLVAEFDCLTVAEDMRQCQTDYFKLQFEADPERSVSRFFKSCATGTILDAVDAIPTLGAFNRERLPGIPFVPPFGATPASHREFSARIAQNLPALRRAFDAAVGSDKGSWQLGWAADLMSESGVLDEADTKLLSSQLGPGLPPGIEWRIRVALARSSRLDPTTIWKAPPDASSPFEARAAMLAAYYLARRSHEGPWNAIGARGDNADRTLYDWLRGNL
jgi:hypothetical protein